MSVLTQIAQSYFLDARDFASRFDLLWERELHKTGRIKSFIDLLIGCECALKAHVVLSRPGDASDDVYRSLLNLGHDVVRLAQSATFMPDRASYEYLEANLAGLNVRHRYSLEAYDSLLTYDQGAAADYAETIGDQRWVLQTRRHLGALIEAARGPLTGPVNADVAQIVQEEQELSALLERARRRWR